MNEIVNEEWNTTVLFVDDEEGILKSYRELLLDKAGVDLSAIKLSRRKRRGETSPIQAQAADKQLKYNLLLAPSGEKAVQLVKQEMAAGKRVAVGFFDMFMPGGMDGLETIKQLRALDPEMLCAVVTAYTDRPLDNIAKLFDNQDEWIYFNKPFTSGELRQSVASLVSLWNRRQIEKKLTGNLERNRNALIHLLEGLSKISRIPPLVIDALLEGIIDIVMGLVKTKDAFLADRDEKGNLSFKYGVGKYSHLENIEAELPKDKYQFICSSIKDKRVKSNGHMACIPLKFSHQVLGIIFIEKEIPHLNDINLLEIFGMHAINLIQNSRLYQDLEASNSKLDQKNKELIQLIRRLTMTEESVQKLATIAITDELTQLSNRRFINKYLKKEFERAQKLKYSLAYIMVDVDNFKEINDTYGHPVGDEVLRELAQIFLENKRANDIIARYGGDEFLIVLCDVDKKNAFTFINRLRKKIEEHEFACNGQKFRLTLSVGLSIHSPHSQQTEEQLLAEADKALYMAKSSGGNRCVFL
jgi:diguanylate cyclase (GGDEF)-like protein